MKFKGNRSALESLETRRLLSSSFASVNSNGTLSVVGTSKADTITVQTSGSKVQAILNGATESFTSSSVKRIWLEAFGGNDKITNKTALQSTLIGDDGNDTIVGGSANDTIQAGSGDDHFDGGQGTNQIDEGTGNDAFDYSAEPGSRFNLQDQVNSASGYDIEVTRSNPTGSGDDFAIQQTNLRTFIGTGDKDQISYALHDDEDGAYFEFYGGAGDDTIGPSGGSGEALLLDGGLGNDTITFQYDETAASVRGEDGDDVINDNSGYPNTSIDGGSGFDVENLNPDTPIIQEPTAQFTVPAGIEQFSVQVDNNLIIQANDLGDTISVIAANATVYGGDGNDQVVATALNNNSSDTTIGHVFLDGGSGNDLLRANAAQNSTLQGDGGNDTLVGGAGNDLISGGDGNDSLLGVKGNDTLLGGADNDTLDGGVGGDSMDGGSGSDWVDYSSRTAPVSILFIDQPENGESGEGDSMVNIENAMGGSGNDWMQFYGPEVTAGMFEGNGGNDTIYATQFNDTLIGGAGNDQLQGNDGNDSIVGGDGNDCLIGGQGNDTMQGDAGADIFQGGGGTDTANYSSRTDNLVLHIDGQADSGAAGEKDQIMGDIENIIGGSGNDLITGNFANNSLEGGAGNDTIWGSSGNDTLVGDAGHDQLYGQDDNDTLIGKDGQTDTLDGGNGTDKASRDNSASVKDQVLSIESFI